MVIPKAMRDAIGLDAGEVDLELVDGAVVVSPPTVAKRVERRDGRVVITPAEPTPTLTDDIVGHTLDDIRR